MGQNIQEIIYKTFKNHKNSTFLSPTNTSMIESVNQPSKNRIKSDNPNLIMTTILLDPVDSITPLLNLPINKFLTINIISLKANFKIQDLLPNPMMATMLKIAE